MRDKIVAALKKLGPSSPTAIANDLGEDPKNVGHNLRAMLGDEEVKAAGASRNRIYGLPDQKLEPRSAPPQQRKKKKSTARATKPSKKARTPRAPKTPPAAAPARDFLTAITADSRLVIVNGAMAPLIFSEKESEQIAELCLAHFEG